MLCPFLFLIGTNQSVIFDINIFNGHADFRYGNKRDYPCPMYRSSTVALLLIVSLVGAYDRKNQLRNEQRSIHTQLE